MMNSLHDWSVENGINSVSEDIEHKRKLLLVKKYIQQLKEIIDTMKIDKNSNTLNYRIKEEDVIFYYLIKFYYLKRGVSE